MSFADHAILWLHVTAAVFTIGPGTAAIMSTPRYIRKPNPVVVGYLFRTTRIYSFATLLTLIFGLILTGMTHKFSQWWISVSLTLFVVAFVLLLIILRDQRRALTALDAAQGAAVADAVEESVQAQVAGEAAKEADAVSGVQPAAITAGATAAGDLRVAAVERGRIASLGGLTALIWLVVLVLMVWH
jgi:predicted MFS family arabinose efflux permease